MYGKGRASDNDFIDQLSSSEKYEHFYLSARKDENTLNSVNFTCFSLPGEMKYIYQSSRGRWFARMNDKLMIKELHTLKFLGF
jgi:hypothetical protein